MRYTNWGIFIQWNTMDTSVKQKPLIQHTTDTHNTDKSQKHYVTEKKWTHKKAHPTV